MSEGVVEESGGEVEGMRERVMEREREGERGRKKERQRGGRKRDEWDYKTPPVYETLLCHTVSLFNCMFHYNVKR